MTAHAFPSLGMRGGAAGAKRRSPEGTARHAYGTAVAMLIPLNLLYWFAPGLGSVDDLESFVNVTGPCFLIAVLLLLSQRVRVVPGSIWTSLFWFPVSSAVFFGFGPLAGVLGKAIRPALSATSLTYFPVTTQELFHANQLSTAGVTLVLAGFWLHLHFREQKWRIYQSRQKHALPAFKPEAVGLTFVFAGAALKYLLIQPAQWGASTVIVPGALSSLASLTDVGFAVIAYLAAQGSKYMRRAFIILWPFHFLLCLLTFAKLDVILAMLLPIIGFYVARPTLRVLAAALVLLTVGFATAQPWVTYGRAVVYERTGTITRAGYGERLSILNDYLFPHNAVAPAPKGYDQGDWWARLNYSEPQARAMALHDRGVRNPSFDGAWMYFIPRALWAGKPIMGAQGVNFYRLVTGNRKLKSNLGVSIYADLYWRFGWRGVLVGCLLIGWFFGELAAQSIVAMRNREFIMLPPVLQALHMALLGTTEFVLTGLIGPFAVYVGYVLVLRLIAKLARGTPHDQQRPVRAV